MDVLPANSPQKSEISQKPQVHKEGAEDQNRFLVTDLNFESDVDYDNLEQHLDHEFNAENDEFFRNDLLFAVQGLGGVKKFNDLEIYIKNNHCEESLKELIRILKRDDPDNPVARLELSKWNILVSDLIPLILTQPQDKKLSFYVIVLLVQITDFPTTSCKEHDFLVSCLQNFKLGFLQENVVKTLMIHLADCISLEAQNRNKIHENMIELIITLIRNLVRIPDREEARNAVNESKRNLQFNLLLIFAKDSVFDALIYLCQDMSSILMKKLNLSFLEIFYHIFSCFKPKWIMSFADDERKHLEELEDSARRQQIKRMTELGTRHSRFGTNLCIKRLLGGGFKVLSNPFKINEDVNKIQNQRSKPIPRNLGAKYQDIYGKNLNEDFKIPGVEESDVKSFKQIIRHFAMDFLEHAYGNLLESLYDDIYKDSERIQENDVINYFVVMEFGLGLARHRFYSQRKEKQLNKENVNTLNIDIEPIIPALQLTQFELVYSHLVREVTRPKKKMVQYRLFYSAITVLLEILYVTQELSLSTDSILRKNSQSLMQNIFHHDITRIIRVGFIFCVPGLLSDNLLKTLIELQMIFFDLLESFSKGKVLTIQTDRRIRRRKELAKKKNAKGDEDMKNFIEKDPEEEKEDGEYDPFHPEKAKPTQEDGKEERGEEESDEEEENMENIPLFQERKFNFMSEFAMISDYGVMTKMLSIIKDDQLLTNDKQINLAVFKYLKKIFDLMKADWMFFQIDYLNIFQGIISNSEIRNKLEFRNFLDLIRKILKSFFNLLQKNKFLLVESLFRFNDKTVKDSILSNYDNDLEMESTHDPQKLFEDFEDDLDVKQINKGKAWYKMEDQTLIFNYDQFKDLPNCEDHLCLLINNMGFSDKEPIDVRRRIKYLKLNRGSEKARELFNEIYENQRISLNLAIKNFLENSKQEKLSKEDVIVLLQEKSEKFKDFKKISGERPKDNLGNMGSIDFALVPIHSKDFDVLESPLVQQIFSALDFRAPGQGEWMWRIPGYFTVNDVENIMERLKRSFETGVVEEDLPIVGKTSHLNYTQSAVNDEEEDKNADLKETIEETGNNEMIEEKEDFKEDFNGKNDSNIEEELKSEKNDDDDENYLDLDEGNVKTEKGKEEKWKTSLTMPLATLENYGSHEYEEDKEEREKKQMKWVEQTLVVPTLDPSE